MNVTKEGWFTEICNSSGNPVLSVDVEEVLHQERSNFQEILGLQEQVVWKRSLVLDNAIQCTERDEFSYQEYDLFLASQLPTQTPRMSLSSAVVTAVSPGRWSSIPSVVSVTQCEIDEKVVEVSKKYLPFMAEGFNSPKLELHIGDGLQFIKDTPRKFDVVITDSSDPVGPAVALFQKQYYEGLKRVLKPRRRSSARPGEVRCGLTVKLIREMVGDVPWPRLRWWTTPPLYTPTYPEPATIGFLLVLLLT
uniref:Putative spermidine synthase n=1 Tax=Ixodes ricinus TaxID=34613 RepID=A0A090X7S3_IXORI